MTTHDRDSLLRLAIAPPVDAAAPADLGDAIYGEILATPQRRGIVRLGRVGWVPSPSRLLLALGLLTLLAFGLVIVALSSRATPGLSTYHGGPDRTGVMPGPGPVGDVVALWDVGRPGPIAFTSMPLPVGDRVLVSDAGGTLAALAVSTGATLWERDVEGAVYGAPAIVDDLVVVGTEIGEVVALDIASGQVAWRRPLDAGAVLASLLVADKVIYAGTEGGRLVALAPVDGRVLWRVDAGGPVARGASAGAGAIVVGTATGRLSAIDARSGSIRWGPVELGNGGIGTPTVADGRIYVGRGLEGGGAHDLVAIDATDGAIIWTFASPGGEQVHMGALAHGRVYGTSEDGVLYALDPASGALLWKAEIGGRLATLATVAGSELFVSSTSKSVHALDSGSGQGLWSVSVVGDPTMGAVVDGRVFVGTSLGRVVAIGGTSR